jgi:hypothetical protein
MANIKKVTFADIEDAATPIVEAAVTTGNVATTVENVVEKPVIAIAENAAESALHVPVVARPIINAYINDKIETRIFALTNLITHEFLPLTEHYVVEIESALIEGAHTAQIKAIIEAKFLAETGNRLLNNAMNFIELTGARFLSHKKG